VEDDGDIIDEVRRSAWKSAIMIIILGVACYFLYLAVKGLYLSIAAMFGCN
jgi:multidrug transporter EmrE-like cation transporter